MPVQPEKRCDMSSRWVDTTPETKDNRANLICPNCGRNLLATNIRPWELKAMLPEHHAEMPRYE